MPDADALESPVAVSCAVPTYDQGGVSVRTAAAVEELDPPLSFRAHEVRTGSVDGARADFEQMTTQLVAATTPGVRSVTANPGDWGIDTFVGELDQSGRATVWQSKYFIDGVDESQKKQIRDAFKSAVAAAEKNRYELDSWILCIPCSLDGPATAWWDGWSKRQSKSSGVPVLLWDETELRKRLISPEGERVRLHYFGRPAGDAPNEREVHDVPLGADLDSALFMRQLSEAGHAETDSAKREFFNAELLAREVMDKGVQGELHALAAADRGAHAIWEHRFNSACATSEGRLLPTLHAEVMADLRSERATLMPQLSTHIVHVCGIAHRVVEDRRAGWVRDWRDVASRHLAEEDQRDGGAL